MPAPVWSAWVRGTHWLVAGCVLANLVNDAGAWHRALGYVALVAVAVRLLHGCLSRHPASRLWWPAPADIRRHLDRLARRLPETRAGHNPLGQYAVYAIWALLALLGLSDWLSRTDALWGDDWPVAWHALCSDALFGLVVLHLAAVLGVSFWQRRNLIKAMLLG